MTKLVRKLTSHLESAGNKLSHLHTRGSNLSAVITPKTTRHYQQKIVSPIKHTSMTRVRISVMCLQQSYEEKKIQEKMNACLTILTSLFRLYMQLPVNGIPMPKLAICSSSPRIYVVLVSYSNCVPPPT